MDINKLRNALVYDRSLNPERTNATLERIIEVFENVVADQEIIQGLKENLKGIADPREPISVSEADKIVGYIDNLNLSRGVLEDIIDQLIYSEISTDEAIAVHKKYKIPVSKLEEDIVPVRGEGSWILDTKGRWFLDMDSNYSATNLGMDNKELARGLYNQANLLISMKEDRVQIARTRFLKEIGQMMPTDLNCFYWQNSGGEAVDKAIKIAKAYTNSKDVVAFKNGFHGRTHGAVAVTWNEDYRKPFLLDDEDWVHFADFNDIESVRKVLDETSAKIIIMEVVQGEEAGNLPADPEFINSYGLLKKRKIWLLLMTKFRRVLVVQQ